MKRDTQTIINEISKLLDELASVTSVPGKQSAKKKSTVGAKTPVVPRGASGALSVIIEEGFLDSPKEMSAVMNKLKEIGHYHTLQTVAMNLLNLTKRRILNRFKNKETKKWEYVIRR